MIELLKPNWIEGAGIALALVLIVFGIAIIRRCRRPPSWWDTPAHRREMRAREQKRRENLPPGQW